MAEKTIASYTAEQTARQFSGELVRPTIHDEALAQRMAEHQTLLRAALRSSVGAFETALQETSPQSSRRLEMLFESAMAGNQRDIRLFTVMMAELFGQALATE